MWRILSVLKQSVSVIGRTKPLNQVPFPFQYGSSNTNVKPPLPHFLRFSSETESQSQPQSPPLNSKEISYAEAKRLMRLVNVEELKTKLQMQGKEVIAYKELLETCESMGVSKSLEEAAALARVLDDAGVVLLFRDKVYLHPDKVIFFLQFAFYELRKDLC